MKLAFFGTTVWTFVGLAACSESTANPNEDTGSNVATDASRNPLSDVQNIPHDDARTALPDGSVTHPDAADVARQVQACDGLAGVGVWQNISAPGLNADYRAADFAIDPVHSGTVYLGTDHFDQAPGATVGVLRTTDCGATWTHVNTGTNADAIDNGRQWTFAINPTNPSIIYTNSGYAQNGLFKSTNGGVDWTDVTPTADGAPGFIGNLQMDPEDPDHLLTTWHTPCGGLHGELRYEDQVGCFHETTDGGLTWRGHYDQSGGTWPSEVRVLLLHGSTWLVTDDGGVLRTTDGGQTYASLGVGDPAGHSSGTLSRMRNGDYFIGYQNGILYSPASSDGAAWTALDGAAWVGEIAESETARWATQQQNSLLTASVTDPSHWSLVSTSPMTCERLKYDPGHHLLYASCGASGFWRAVVQ